MGKANRASAVINYQWLVTVVVLDVGEKRNAGRQRRGTKDHGLMITSPRNVCERHVITSVF